MPARVSSRVLRHERVRSLRLTPWGGMAKGASEAHCDASARRWKAVALPPSATLCCLRACCGRTGAVGGTKGVARRSSGQSHAAQPVSTKSLCEVQSRMTTRIGAPQVGQRASRGGKGVRGGG